MNDTVETTQDAIQSAGTAKVGRTGRSRAWLIALSLAVTGLVGLSPTVALGAGTAANDVKACFTWSNGTAYANQRIFLFRRNAANTNWGTGAYRSGWTNAGGCGVFVDVTSSRWYYAQAYYVEPCIAHNWYYWTGYSNTRYVGASSNATLTLPARDRVTGPYWLSVC